MKPQILTLLNLFLLGAVVPYPLSAGAPARGPDGLGEPVTPLSVDIDLSTLPGIRPWQPGDPIREVPRRSFPGDAVSPPRPADAPQPDPLPALQSDFDAAGRAVTDPQAPAALSGPLQNFTGIAYNGINPPDVTMDVGPNHVIVSTNGANSSPFRIYDKSGVPLTAEIEMDTLAGGDANCTTGWGDPVVLYDRLADRWFMLEFLQTQNYLCVYISKTANPVSGGWWMYKFLANAYPDYPHCGVWPDAYYCTANEGTTNRPVYAYDRINMLSGLPARPQQRFTIPRLSGYSFQTLTAVNFNGATSPPPGMPMLLMRHHDDEAHDAGPNPAADFIDLYSLSINWTTPASSSLITLPQLPVAEYNSSFEDYTTFDTVPQPGTTRKLDPIREVIMNTAVYRNFGAFETVVGVFSINQNAGLTKSTPVDAAVRWFEMRRSCAGPWKLKQQGTFSPGDANTHHFMGAISIDQGANLAFGMNVTKTSAATLFASIRYTGRLATDAAGIMSQGEQTVQTGGGINSSGRWGDYSQMGMDPADDCTFWYGGMYQPSTQWATRIAAFKFAECAPCAAGAAMSDLTGAKSGADFSAAWSALPATAHYNVYRGDTPTTLASWGVAAGCLVPNGWNDPGVLGDGISHFYSVTHANVCGVESPR